MFSDSEESMELIIEDLFNHCRDGGSFETFPAKKSIPPRKIKNWCESSVEFREAVEQACTIEMLYWEDKLRQALLKDLKESPVLRICEMNLSRIRETLEKAMKQDLFKKEEKKFSAVARSDSDIVKEAEERFQLTSMIGK